MGVPLYLSLTQIDCFDLRVIGYLLGCALSQYSPINQNSHAVCEVKNQIHIMLD